MGHIFISYSHKDSSYVHKLTEALEKEGFKVWIDDRIHYGSEWPKVVTRNLDISDGVIVVLSNNSYESDMVQNELARAREKKIPIFPLLLEGENWLIVQAKQFVDVKDGSLPTEKFYKRLEEITPRKNERAEREAAEKAAQEKAKRDAAEKAEREKAERAEKEKLEREATEKAKRNAVEKAKRARAERQTARKATLAKTISDFLVTLKSTRPKAKPILRVISIIGIIIVLFWVGSWGVSKLASLVPTLNPTTTQLPTAQITPKYSPVPPTRTPNPNEIPTKTQSPESTFTSTQSNGNAQSPVNLSVHYVEGVHAEDKASYNVQVYLSVVDVVGNPIRDIRSDSFSIAENSRKVEITSLGVVTEPINIVLIMDTSGSMAGTKINDAKTAVANFISRLGDNDRIAFLTFDEFIKLQTDFTSDRSAIRDRIASIDANANAGTCLYDAAYQAVQLASMVPYGRRAVILFTDGVDETSTGGRVCSVYTTDDVIDLASEGWTRTPIYTLGLGNHIDENMLKRIANLTGGRYIYSPDTSQLENVFQMLSEQLRSQYVLTYKSFAAPGAHTLAVNVNHLGSQDNDTRNFILPALPARVIFLSPLDGETVMDAMKVVATVSGGSETIKRVDFEVNGEVLGSDSTAPYELELDATQFPLGTMTVSVVAYGENNLELARGSLNLMHTEIIVEPVTASPTEIISTPTSTKKPSTGFAGDLGGLGLLVMVVVLVIIILLARRLRAA